VRLRDQEYLSFWRGWWTRIRNVFAPWTQANKPARNPLSSPLAGRVVSSIQSIPAEEVSGQSTSPPAAQYDQHQQEKRHDSGKQLDDFTSHSHPNMKYVN
jgi:hypothetical protein